MNALHHLVLGDDVDGDAQRLGAERRADAPNEPSYHLVGNELILHQVVFGIPLCPEEKKKKEKKKKKREKEKLAGEGKSFDLNIIPSMPGIFKPSDVHRTSDDAKRVGPKPLIESSESGLFDDAPSSRPSSTIIGILDDEKKKEEERKIKERTKEERNCQYFPIFKMEKSKERKVIYFGSLNPCLDEMHRIHQQSHQHRASRHHQIKLFEIEIIPSNLTRSFHLGVENFNQLDLSKKYFKK